MKKLTKRQQELLDLLSNSIKEEGLPPTFSEIAASLGIKSKNAVSKLLKSLEDKGYIKRSSKARGIKILNSLNNSLIKGLKRVPLIGEVQAGTPIAAEQNIEDWINIPESLAQGRTDVFILKVRGDSMQQAGLFEDDLVIVNPKTETRPGDIVVGLVGTDVTVKRLMVDRNGQPYLKAENPDYANIYPDQEWSIQGKVVGMIRSLE